MKLNKSLLILTIIFISISFLIFFLLKKVPYSYSDNLSYNQIYYTTEQLRVTDIEWNRKDSVFITFAGNQVKQQNSFTVYRDGVKILEQISSVLRIKPEYSLKKYYVKINHIPDSIAIDIDLSPENIYGNSGNSNKTNLEITSSSIPLRTKHLLSLEDWRWQDSPEKNDDNDLAAYLTDSIKLLPEDNAEKRVIKIASYILSLTYDKNGIPSDSLEALSPIRQLEAVRKGKSRIWCGNYSTIFAFFANHAGIPARLIETGTPNEEILNGSHVFNEVYLKEDNCWAYVDLTDGNIFVKKQDKYLNAVDIYRLLRYKSIDFNLQALHYEKDSLLEKPFTTYGYFAKRSLNYSNTLKFYYRNYKSVSQMNIIEKITNLLYGKPYYALYSDNLVPFNYNYYFILILSYLLLAILLIGAYFSILFFLRHLLMK